MAGVMDLIWAQAQLRRDAAHWHDGQITRAAVQNV
jgi:hypothetical protein